MPAHQSTPTLRSVRDLTDEELGELLASQGRVIEVEEKLGLRYPTSDPSNYYDLIPESSNGDDNV